MRPAVARPSPSETADFQNLVATFALGASAGVTDGNGILITQQRYLPFGAERTDAGAISQTDLGYTGQRDLGMGLMDYHARFYSPYLGRFTQPDTITPGGPQGLNRFSYVGNNPVNLNDPTGHRVVSPCSEMAGGCNVTQDIINSDNIKATYFRQRTDFLLCKAGNELRCSSADTLVNNTTSQMPRVVGVTYGNSTQIGDAAEVGYYNQTSYYFDWIQGDLYRVRTQGAYLYAGTPTFVSKSFSIGTSTYHGIPLDAKQVGPFLSGFNLDLGGSGSLQPIPVVGLGKGRSVSYALNGNSVARNKYELPIYSNQSAYNLSFSPTPPGVSFGVQGGLSSSDVSKIYSISWWPK
ncbi:MAG: RHS repeat-associated core domain-containing protein [Chloroflexi bacterium]|nr:RHS repeat-associated core domain-containing protein [Chloroflexota bacterium]